MTPFYPTRRLFACLFLFLIYLAPIKSHAQCGATSVLASATESRCEASGSIAVNVTGEPGSSLVTYSIVTAPPLFPVTQLNAYQSSNTFEALPEGNYQVVAQISSSLGNCLDTISIVVPGNYVQLDLTSTTNDNTLCASQPPSGSVSVQGLNGRPFAGGIYQYQLVSPAAFATSNTTGIFAGLPGGTYAIRVYDSCGNFQTRDITVKDDVVTDNYLITYTSRVACDTVVLNTLVVNPDGSINGNYAGFTYGYYDDLHNFVGYQQLNNVFNVLVARDTFTVFFKDPCGNVTTVKDSTGAIRYANGFSINSSVVGSSCTSFNANFNNYLVDPGSNPVFTLTCAPVGALVGLSSNSGIFNNLPYGNYCVNITNSCGGSQTFMLTAGYSFSLINAAVIPHNCSGGMGSLGLFGTYQVVTPLKVEIIDSSRLPAQIIRTSIFDTVYYGMSLADSLPLGHNIYVRFTDPCGNTATQGPYIFNTLHLTDWDQITPLCINKADVRFSVQSNGSDPVYASATGPGGYSYPQQALSPSGTDTLSIVNLPVGTYYVQTNNLGCSSYQVDTLIVQPYAQPSIAEATSFTCDSTVASNFSLTINSQGGLPVFSYAIVGSSPDNIVRAPQSSPTFNGLPENEIVQVRAVDGCGNSTSSNVTIKNLKAPSILLAGTTCPGTTVTLETPTIGSFTYQWLLNGVQISSGESDSLLTIPAFSDLDTGIYTISVVPTSGCVAAQASIPVTDFCAVLAFQLNNFTAQNENDHALLHWQTSNEGGFVDFEIQKSADGQHFSKIGTVTAKNDGALTSSYAFADPQDLAGLTYYRLKIVNAYAEGSYSKTAMLSTESFGLSSVKFYPNPFVSEITVSLTTDRSYDAQVQLFDITGRMVHSENWAIGAGSNEKAITLSTTLSKGTYIVKVTSNNQVLFQTNALKI